MNNGSNKDDLMKMSGGTGFVQCAVSDGMFNGEKIVSFNVQGRTISASVGEASVTSSGRLVVEIYSREGSRFLIGIPGESFSSSRKIWVPEADLILEK